MGILKEFLQGLLAPPHTRTHPRYKNAEGHRPRCPSPRKGADALPTRVPRICPKARIQDSRGLQLRALREMSQGVLPEWGAVRKGLSEGEPRTMAKMHTRLPSKLSGSSDIRLFFTRDLVEGFPMRSHPAGPGVYPA